MAVMGDGLSSSITAKPAAVAYQPRPAMDSSSGQHRAGRRSGGMRQIVRPMQSRILSLSSSTSSQRNFGTAVQHV